MNYDYKRHSNPNPRISFYRLRSPVQDKYKSKHIKDFQNLFHTYLTIKNVYLISSGKSNVGSGNELPLIVYSSAVVPCSSHGSFYSQQSSPKFMISLEITKFLLWLLMMKGDSSKHLYHCFCLSFLSSLSL